MAIFIIILILSSLVFWLFKEFKRYGVSLIFMVIIWSIVIYCLAPIALILSYNDVASPRFLSNIYDVDYLAPVFVVFIFFVSMYLGTLAIVGKKFKIEMDFSATQTRKTSLIVFVIGVLSLLFFIQSYGGLQYVLSNMSQIRSGTDDNKNYLAAFVASFSKYINLSFLIMLA
ncbi:hypothetical protein LQE78_002686, partial [Acinetobacter baumannii]|nr:hypothetical protein [Acinetobacter baumannii]